MIDTSMIERWEEYRRTEDRAKFDQHLEGLLAVQQVQVFDYVANAVDLTWEECDDILRGALLANELNAKVLLDNGAEEV